MNLPAAHERILYEMAAKEWAAAARSSVAAGDDEAARFAATRATHYALRAWPDLRSLVEVPAQTV